MNEKQVAEVLRIAGSRASEMRRYLESEGVIGGDPIPAYPEPESNAQVEGADVETEEEEDDA